MTMTEQVPCAVSMHNHSSQLQCIAFLIQEVLRLRLQVSAIQDACLLVGAHGAGLSQVLFAPSRTHLLELQPPTFERPHFTAYAHWAGSYPPTWILDSSTPDPQAVIQKVRETLQTATKG